jgi:hypothetical protein
VDHAQVMNSIQSVSKFPFNRYRPILLRQLGSLRVKYDRKGSTSMYSMMMPWNIEIGQEAMNVGMTFPHRVCSFMYAATSRSLAEGLHLKESQILMMISLFSGKISLHSHVFSPSFLS